MRPAWAAHQIRRPPPRSVIRRRKARNRSTCRSRSTARPIARSATTPTAMSDAAPDVVEAWRGTLDLLRDAHVFLADERHWCQYHTLHPDGRCSVLGTVGNLLCQAENPWTRAATQLLARAIGRGNDPYDGGWVQHYNDSHNHTEVLALIDAALVLGEMESLRPNTPPRAWRVVGGKWPWLQGYIPSPPSPD